jgi:hypothetical protein
MNSQFMKFLCAFLFLILIVAHARDVQRDTTVKGRQWQVEKLNYDMFDGCTLQLLKEPSRLYIPAPERFRQGVQTATFIVDYEGFTPQAQAAFQYAVDIWSSILVSSVPIRIKAKWAPLATGVLGSAGPNGFANDGSKWFPIALAEAMGGAALNNPDSADIKATFSSSFSNWYLGTDGNPASNEFDFVSVVLHELGHGLGFIGSMEYNNGSGSWGGGTSLPFVYDIYAVNGSGQQLIDTNIFPNPSMELGQQLVSNNLFYNSPKTVSANGGTPAPIYAPNPWEQGSSYSHFDEATYGGTQNALMTPSIAPGEVIHSPGPLMLALFEDNGWTVSSSGGPITKLEQTFSSSTLPVGWQTLDLDGNGTTWALRTQVDFGNGQVVNPQTGTHFLFSSFNSANGSTINDWIITPQLVGVQSGDKISFYAGAIGGSFPDSLRVLVSTTDTNPASFTTQLDYFQVAGPIGNWTKYQYDISAFAGQNIYVAIVYYHLNGGITGSASDNIWVDHFEWIGSGIVGIEDDPAVVTTYKLDQNYPNPFNPSTIIRYQIPKASDVKLSVYNVLGQEVAVLVNTLQSPGIYEVSFDAGGLSSGIYFYRLQAGEVMQTRRMLLTR